MCAKHRAQMAQGLCVEAKESLLDEPCPLGGTTGLRCMPCRSAAAKLPGCVRRNTIMVLWCHDFTTSRCECKVSFNSMCHTAVHSARQLK